MTSLASQLPKSLLPVEPFSLTFSFGKEQTDITMTMAIPVVNTRTIPQTYKILRKMLPTVLMSQCFNDEKLPFAKEVRQTEMGHLFEHILLEYLCIFRLTTGAEDASYEGVTSWNWQEEHEGVFHITLNAGTNDADIFDAALTKTMALMQLILAEHRVVQPYTPLSIPQIQAAAYIEQA